MAAMKPSTLRIGYRYRPSRLADSYDAIVIGSGMGGLTTAALLSEHRDLKAILCANDSMALGAVAAVTSLPAAAAAG